MSVRTFLGGRVTLHSGDCLDVLANLPANSVDSVVCDPPYHLTSIVKRFGGDMPPRTEAAVGKHAYGRHARGFMGKTWDGGDIAFQPATWAAVLRVLKPGGYLLAFASTRGFGRMSVAIEDAGFISHPMIDYLTEHADAREFWAMLDNAQRSALARLIMHNELGGMLAWIFGSGFPKATRIKAEGYDGFRYGGQALKPAIEPIFMGQKPFEHGLNGTENILRHGTGAINIDACRIPSAGQRPDGVATWEDEPSLCNSCAEVAESTTKPGTPATREYSVASPVGLTSNGVALPSQDDTGRTDIGCSAGTRAENTSINSSTGEFGNRPTDQSPKASTFTTSTKTNLTTGLKTCASCQQPITENTTSGNITAERKNSQHGVNKLAPTESASKQGRWPANIIHDGSEEVLAGFPHTKSGLLQTHHKMAESENGSMSGKNYARSPNQDSFGDEGSAARFFYTAKANAEDRLGSKHPTLKPLDLMQYLCRLVTPPGGTILDPFAGTGTTGEAAWREGFKAILIEREPEYQADIARRMDLAERPAKRAAVAATKNKIDDLGPLFEAAE